MTIQWYLFLVYFAAASVCSWLFVVTLDKHEQPRVLMRSKAPYLLVALLLIAIVMLIYWLWEPASANGDQANLARELVKSLMQLGLITVVGSLVAAWFKYYWEEESRERERLRELARERGLIYRDYISRLGNAYREVKAIRRTLRASGLRLKAELPAVVVTGPLLELYKEQMSRINQAQLQLEGLKIEARSHPELRETKGIYSHLKNMEKYLGPLISEYEGIIQDVPLSYLVHLDEFTDSSDAKEKSTKRRFEAHFASAYGEVVRLLGQLLERVDDSRRTPAYSGRKPQTARFRR